MQYPFSNWQAKHYEAPENPLFLRLFALPRAKRSRQPGEEHRYQPLPGCVRFSSGIQSPCGERVYRDNCTLGKRRRHTMHMRTGT